MDKEDCEAPPSSVIARAASVLRALSEAPGGMSLGQIARRCGLARSTVQRLVAGLAAERLVVAAGGAGQIALGPELLRLGAAMRADAATRLRADIRTLAAELGETVDLSVIRDSKVVFVDQAPGAQRLLVISQVGAAFPLHCCASGKAYLSQLSDQAVEQAIGARYGKFTPRTLTTLDDLLRDLAATRRRGVAIDDQEHTEGISAVGIGVTDGTGGWFGVSVPMPTQRFNDMRPQVIDRIKALQASYEPGERMNVPSPGSPTPA